MGSRRVRVRARMWPTQFHTAILQLLRRAPLHFRFTERNIIADASDTLLKICGRSLPWSGLGLAVLS